jgi:hypothetical protein
VGDGTGRLPAIRISIKGVTRSAYRALSQYSFSICFFQIFARRAKIWKKKDRTTLLPQANPAGEYATT